MTEYTNSLIHETSPYLLQHAHNPVNWFSWNGEALEKARKEDKPLIVSIGYSACHWCHVMESETFMDPDAAELMNSRFVCIKVDREERPDIDYRYMEAVQLLTGRGGWPLNVFALPDGRPFFGGTYFPNGQWKSILTKVGELFRTDRNKLISQAELIESNMNQNIPALDLDPEETITQKPLETSVGTMARSFDLENGGFTGAPKFPMPGLWRFLLRYAYHFQDDEIKNHVLFTVHKMLAGGIFDHTGGGFARYSVDPAWKVPHFEKMLYDNAQLLTLTAEAYKISGYSRFLQGIRKTVEFMKTELQDHDGGFYSSIDADSSGREGRFYTWTFNELERLLGSHPGKEAFYLTFGIREEGNWEDGLNIIFRSQSIKETSDSLRIPESKVEEYLNSVFDLIRQERETREKPGLDTKIIAAWNGLTLSGLCAAYTAVEDRRILDTAGECAGFIKTRMIKQGRLRRAFTQGRLSSEVFLDDCAFCIKGMLDLYGVTGEEDWFHLAYSLTEQAMEEFKVNDRVLFNFSPSSSDDTWDYQEVQDNVIPSSNSVMAENLFLLSRLSGNQAMETRARSMIRQMYTTLLKYPQFHYGWGSAALNILFPFFETAVTGPEAEQTAFEFRRKYLPGTVIVFAKNKSSVPILKSRTSPDQTRIFICRDKTCFPPTDREEAFRLLTGTECTE